MMFVVVPITFWQFAEQITSGFGQIQDLIHYQRTGELDTRKYNLADLAGDAYKLVKKKASDYVSTRENLIKNGRISPIHRFLDLYEYDLYPIRGLYFASTLPLPTRELDYESIINKDKLDRLNKWKKHQFDLRCSYTGRDLVDYIVRSPLAIHARKTTDSSKMKYSVALSALWSVSFRSNQILDCDQIDFNWPHDASLPDLAVHFRSSGWVDETHEEFQLAVLYAACAVANYGIFCAHNWCHFHLGEIVAVEAGTTLPKSTQFGKLLSVHTRYHCEINRGAFTGLSSLRMNNQYHDEVAGFPAHGIMPNSTFKHNIMLRTMAFFYHQHYPDNFRDIPYVEDILSSPVQFSFPFPVGFEASSPFPYISVLRELYDSTLIFCRQVCQEIGKDPAESGRMSLWVQGVLKFFPKEQHQTTPAELLALYIWQSSIVHSIDHVLLYRFIKKFKFPTFFNLPFSEASKGPKAYQDEDRQVFQRFAELVVSPPNIPNSYELLPILYEFESKELQALIAPFLKNIQESFEKLEVRLSDISTSLCY